VGVVEVVVVVGVEVVAFAMTSASSTEIFSLQFSPLQVELMTPAHTSRQNNNDRNRSRR